MPLPVSSAAVVIAEDVSFAAGPYRLHGRLAYPEAERPRGVVVLAAPHPLLGGDMDNNVIRTLGDGLADRGLATMRFNYRGVGRSEGPAVDVARHLADFWQTSHVPDEMDLWRDVDAAAAFAHAAVGADVPVALAGYSFGCALLPYVRVGGAWPPLVLVAPTIGRHDYEPFRTLDNPLLVIASDDDFAADAGRLQSWFEARRAPGELILNRFDNHFFRGHEVWLADTVSEFLCRHWRLAR
jgi:alpha/beta superfamily hydrolase